MNNAFRLSVALCFALIITTAAKAQTADSAQKTDTAYTAQFNHFDKFNGFYQHPMGSHYQGSMLMAHADLEYSSNAAVNTLAYDFYLQNPIHPSSIKSTVENLTAINIGGRESSMGIKYIFPTKKYNNFFFVDYRYRSHQSVRFSDEFGKFFFQGNKQFAGDTMDGNDLRYLRTRYDALQFGWLNYFALNGRRAIISVSAGVVRGFDYWRLNAKKLTLFTEENGNYIEATLGMEAERSRYVALKPFNAAGFGALADIDFKLLLNEKSAIGINVSDLGFVSWDNRSAVYKRGDTTIYYDGVFVPSIDSLSSSTYTERIGDSIVTRFNIPYESGGFTSMLPTKISLTYYMGFTKTNFLNVRLQLMAFTNFRPQLNIESLNFVSNKVYSLTGIALGGFGPWDIYQKVGYQINKRYFAAVGLFGIEGMVAPNSLAGFGGNISFAAKL